MRLTNLLPFLVVLAVRFIPILTSNNVIWILCLFSLLCARDNHSQRSVASIYFFRQITLCQGSTWRWHAICLNLLTMFRHGQTHHWRPPVMPIAAIIDYWFVRNLSLMPYTGQRKQEKVTQGARCTPLPAMMCYCMITNSSPLHHDVFNFKFNWTQFKVQMKINPSPFHFHFHLDSWPPMTMAAVHKWLLQQGIT